MVDELQEEIKGKVTTPAQDHLFHVYKSCQKLDKDHSAWFHTSVPKYYSHASEQGRTFS